jgi:thiol-disulfide isomerase/thioredoxin
MMRLVPSKSFAGDRQPLRGGPAGAIVAAALLVVLVAACGGAEPRGPRPDPREIVVGSGATAATATSYPLPDLELRTLGGRRLATDELRGRVIVVNFWATWCGPCLREIPDLVRLSGEHAAGQLEVVGIALNDPDSTAVSAFVRDHGMTYPVVVDHDGRIADALGGVFVMPTTFLVDTGGTVVGRIAGIAHPDSLRADVQRLLAAGG